jgi:hypothetical protein
VQRFQRPPCFYRILCGAFILQFRTALPPILCCLYLPHTFAAYICRIHFPPTFAAYIFRLHLPHTFATYIFRLHFEQVPSFYACANILGKCQYFNDFCLILLLQMFVYISSIYLCSFVCADIFGAIVLKPRFKIDVVIMII